MAQFDLSKSQSSNLTPGLQDLGSIPPVTQTLSGTIPIAGSLSTTIYLNFPINQIISLVKINVSGGNLGAYWFPIMGTLGLLDYTNVAGLSGGYYMYFTVQSSSTGRQITVQVANRTVGGNVTIPTLTFTVNAHLYNYSW